MDTEEKKKIVVLSSEMMGSGDDKLGTILMKNFIYSITQLEELPNTFLLYNGAVKLACNGSESLEDLEGLQASGVKILCCGTCLKYFGLTDQLAVGEISNMYTIAETQMDADLIIRP